MGFDIIEINLVSDVYDRGYIRMSPSNTVEQGLMSSMGPKYHSVTKNVTKANSIVDTVSFSNTADLMEPSTSTSMNTMTLSTTTAVDTKALSIQVKHYLKSNQIKWSKFSSLVLGVSQSRLSTLLNKPEPFNSLTRRVQALYNRMDLWMRTKATYGNNPYSEVYILQKEQVYFPNFFFSHATMET